ncbi:Uma2 family endonuclease [Streptomyces sp. Li-HN-5-11]|uniref:Uma2 family endonuclease n=1 Tax=Streptomyces sp. Li-HN-5-11 TaxID=3075432 RepID=UPI0028AAE8CB|nr:Uma2 family endonuclease [Streptomyces sp. Li-HN-5-11]WNM35113.1 Uma2 family endonuclease [Streptomyces sp. Li-HN-5-11]
MGGKVADVMEKIKRDLELMRAIMRRMPEIEGVDLQMADGFIMMAPVRPVHSETIRKALNQIDDQLPAEQDLAVSSDVEFVWEEWGKDYAPDAIVWEGQAFRDNLTSASADLVTFACEVISPSSVELDYLDKAAAFARVPFAAYLVLDPYVRRAVLHSQPQDGIYHLRKIVTYGDPVEIELPFGTIVLDTSKLPVAPKDEQRTEWPKLLP